MKRNRLNNARYVAGLLSIAVGIPLGTYAAQSLHIHYGTTGLLTLLALDGVGVTVVYGIAGLFYMSLRGKR